MLYEQMFCTCTKLIQTDTQDEYGTYNSVWVDGETFSAALVPKASPSIEASKVTDSVTYAVTFPTSYSLAVNDVFKRCSDGKTFKVTTGDVIQTPDTATFSFKQVTATEWRLPA